MKKTFFITAALFTAMTTTTFAYADSDHKQRNHVSFEQMDTNQDGKIAKDETTGRLAKHFDKYDTDNNGFITKAEMPTKVDIIKARCLQRWTLTMMVKYLNKK